MECNLVELNYIRESSVLNDFEEALHDHSLQYRASTLANIGFEDYQAIEGAIGRAMRICTNSGLPIQEHFKSIYVADEDNHSVKRDWKLSKLAYSLAILNGAPDIPVVCQIQIELARKWGFAP